MPIILAIAWHLSAQVPNTQPRRERDTVSGGLQALNQHGEQQASEIQMMPEALDDSEGDFKPKSRTSNGNRALFLDARSPPTQGS